MDLGLGGRTVLLVAADDPLRTVVSDTFAAEGARVLTATLAPDDPSWSAALREPIDVVVVLEATPDARPIDWVVDPEAVDRAWDPVIGAVELYQQVVPSMRERGFGRLVHIGSANSRDVAELGSDLGLVAGLGLRALHKVIADECGPDGITTTSVLRGRIATDDDVAACAVWLASDVAGYLTGVTISIDGGLASTVF
jgi:NAD(P)-dependent dehydrogenase (short-subunit alcohol dehydrogenase family)